MVFFIGGKMFKKKNKELTEEEKEVIRTKSFFDMILPATIKFSTDHYVCGDSYRCVHYTNTKVQNKAIYRVLSERGKTVYATAFMAGAIVVDNGNIKLLGNVKAFNK